MAKSVAFDDLSGLSDEQQAVLKAFRDMDTDSDGELTAQGAGRLARGAAFTLFPPSQSWWSRVAPRRRVS